MAKREIEALVGHLVRLSWLDAYREDTDSARSEAANLRPVEVQDLGELIYADQDCVVIATGQIVDTSGTVSFRWSLSIPRSLVIRIQELTLA